MKEQKRRRIELVRNYVSSRDKSVQYADACLELVQNRYCTVQYQILPDPRSIRAFAAF